MQVLSEPDAAAHFDRIVTREVPGRRGLEAWDALLRAHATLLRQLETDLDNLKRALKGVAVADVFVPCISPANIEDWNDNKYYKSDEEYLFAIADAMNVEYKAIADAGFLVQIDDPRLSSYYLMNPSLTIEQVVEAGNQ